MVKEAVNRFEPAEENKTVIQLCTFYQEKLLRQGSPARHDVGNALGNPPL